MSQKIQMSQKANVSKIQMSQVSEIKFVSHFNVSKFISMKANIQTFNIRTSQSQNKVSVAEDIRTFEISVKGKKVQFVMTRLSYFIVISEKGLSLLAINFFCPLFIHSLSLINISISS